MRDILCVWTDRQCLKRMLISGALFLILAAPFRALFNLIPGVTEIRPANVLPVVFGLLWGPAGAFGTAIANAFSDIFVSHSPVRVWAPGFFINFFFSYLPWKLWYCLPELDGCVKTPRLSNVRQIFKYMYICLIDSLVITTCLGFLFEVLGFQPFRSSVLLLFFNNFDFAIVLGVPMILLLTSRKDAGLWLPSGMERLSEPPLRDSSAEKKSKNTRAHIFDSSEAENPAGKADTACGRIADRGLFFILSTGIIYDLLSIITGMKAGKRMELIFLSLFALLLLFQFTRRELPLLPHTSDSLPGMSIRGKVIVGFLMLAVAFVLLTGTTAFHALWREGGDRRTVWQYIYTVVGLALNLLFAVSLFFLSFAERNITGPLEALTKAAKRFAGFDHKEVERNRTFISGFSAARTGDEIEELSVSFGQMMTDITDYVENLEKMTKEKERIGAELAVATQIQADMLPRIFPPFPDRSEFDIFASMNPAKEVGGDFYDFFLVDKAHLGIVIADVSGKGVPAALFMVIAKTLIKNHAQFGASPAEIFSITNNQLCEGNEAGLFVTAWLGILNLENGELRYVNAGHNPPLLKHREGGYSYLKSPAGFVLAGFEDISYRESSLKLSAGDMLLLYTDGVTEAENRAQEQFGEERLLRVAVESGQDTAKRLIFAVREAVSAFSDGAEQFDDITLLALRYRGASAEPAGSEEAAESKEEAGEKEENMRALTVPADTGRLDEVQSFVREALLEAKVDESSLFPIEVAVEEIFVNIANYAYAPAGGDVEICCRTKKDPLSAIIRFSDAGKPYNPLEKPDPDIEAGAEGRDIGGLGIFLTKKYMDDVQYSHENGKNILILRKRIR
ncbi:MAG: SpoIIE family protein phosphatase [Eubacteriales bacterium]|nr:SpoIIE family protein phosphatase [Eubacteriales bacterium]